MTPQILNSIGCGMIAAVVACGLGAIHDAITLQRTSNGAVALITVIGFMVGSLIPIIWA